MLYDVIRDPHVSDPIRSDFQKRKIRFDSTRLDPKQKKIISRSSDPISAIFFLLDSPRRAR